MMNVCTRSAAGCLSRCMQLLALLVLAPAITKSELTGGYMTSTYSCNWTYDQPTDTISFVIHATQGPNTWTAVAFSPTPNMENQDTIYGYVELEVGHVVDAYVGSRFSPPVADTMSNIHDASVQYVGGVLTMMFQRPRVSPDTTQDVSFTDTPTLYFKFPDGGGPMSGSTILKHTKTPIISQQMICIGPCGATTMAQPSTNQAMSSTTTISMGSSAAGGATSPTMAAGTGGSSSTQGGMSSSTQGGMSSSPQSGMSSSPQGGVSSSTQGGMSSPGGMSSSTQGGMSSSPQGGMSSSTQGGMSSPGGMSSSTKGGMSSSTKGGMSSGTQGGMSSPSTILMSGTQGGISSPGGMSSSTQGGMSSHGGMSSPGGMSSQSGMTGQPGGSTESSSKGSNSVLLATIIASVVVFSVLVVLIFCVCCFC